MTHRSCPLANSVEYAERARQVCPPKVPRPMGELHPLPSNERFLKPNKKVPQKVPRPIRKLDPLPSNTRFLEPDEYVPQKVPCPIGRTRPPSTQRTVPSAHSSLHPKQHVDRFIRCRRTHGRDQQTDRQADHATAVTTDRILC